MNQKRSYIFRMILLVCVVCVITLVKTENAYAADHWYDDYSYSLAKKSNGNPENYIYLYAYNGQATRLYVPSTAIIDGIAYKTYLCPSEVPSLWYNTRTTLTEIQFGNGCVVGSHSSNLFSGLSKLKSVNTEALDVSGLTSTASMFADCSSLTSLNVSNWDTSNVTNMFNMFGGCEKLAKLDVSKWNTSNVTIMISVFDHCKSLHKIDVQNWDVSNVTTVDFMFYKCEKLASLDLHKWDTSNIDSMYELFGRCYSLRKINLKGWDTSNVTTMAGMFCCDYNLVSVDLSSFDMSKVKFRKHDDDMFIRCGSLKTVKAPKNRKTKLKFNSGLTYKKKGSSKVYDCIPKGKKSITLVCVKGKSASTSITSVKSSKKKITVTWKPVATSDYSPIQYEVQCSTNKNFTDAVGTMTNAISDGITFCVQDNITNGTKATFKGLTKGKTYYVRVRVYTYNKLLSKWSKTKKIKCK